MNLKTGILLVLILSLGFKVQAQDCNLSIRGKIIHLENNEPIEAAYIWVIEAEEGAVSDQNGNFTVRNLCKGTYTVTIQYLGHKGIKDTILLESGTFTKTYRLEEEALGLQSVEVHGHRDAVTTTTAVSALYGEALLESRGENLGESLRRISGVSTFSTGNSISKPVIHGMHSNRIMIMNNGIRLEGQQWGAEHAPEIDPFLADEITVVKGAETVRYGPEAMGGVILVNPAPLPTKKTSKTSLNLIAGSNGRMGNINLVHVGGSDKIKGLGYRVQGSAKRSGNVKSPGYFQRNTGVSELNLSSSVGYSAKKIGIEAYYSLFQSELGILTDAHTGNLSDLEAIIENGRPFTDGEFDYAIINPKQRVTHHLAKLKSHYHISESWKLNFQYGFQLNHRQEFDKRRGDLNENASLDLELFTNTIDLYVNHTHENEFSGTWGINFIQQANTNIPGTGVTPLIPNYDMANVGFYAMEKYSKGPLEVEAGLRYDFRNVSTARYIGQELRTAKLDYQNLSAFIGGLYHISPDLTFNSNLGSAWRPPNVNELFSEGLHHGAAAVEIGNSDLESEKSLKWINELQYDGKRTHLEFTAYLNPISDYIYLNPTGEVFVSLRGTFNIYEYLQANALFYGFDFAGSYEFTDRISGYLKGSIVQAKNTDNDSYFPFIPSNRMDWGISYDFAKDAGSPTNKITVSNVLVAKQNREPAFDIAPPPPAYALFNLSYQKQFNLADDKLNLGLQVQNLFNTSYKDYMNRFRYFTYDMGTNILLKINYEF
ncbi:iron complex outermembrane receptor protein [Algoriphagus ratkowskyi]|uniref:Iron complex outermembrane receptor protein n=1 Tax=Algoriphagus ratkowskyi TaxID=57028 RepID=A0A2W7R6C3_9BACT|nr:TonB-dependent receptor [Algoriphagus ratkowskyi]PZX53880.1 iron complex outermembrane receptor protein [Algoriphagus ratkowskyi]TXD76716.1 TonB-dependent receptor [Algoriphagus ratkowskyi]